MMDPIEYRRGGEQPADRQTTPLEIDWPVMLRTAARWALSIGVVALILWLLYQAGATLTPFIFGFILAYLLLPIVKRLDRYLPRWGSITAVFLVGLILFELAFIFIVPPAVSQIGQAIRTTPTWFHQVQQGTNPLRHIATRRPNVSAPIYT